MALRHLNRTYGLAAALALVAVMHPVFALAGQPAECGDIDGNGRVMAGDALMVLRKAVGLPMPYLCLVSEPATSTTTSTMDVVVDECFDDTDCQGNPGGAHCCSYECAECGKNTDCDAGEYCSFGCECLAMP